MALLSEQGVFYKSRNLQSNLHFLSPSTRHLVLVQQCLTIQLQHYRKRIMSSDRVSYFHNRCINFSLIRGAVALVSIGREGKGRLHYHSAKKMCLILA